MASLYQTAQLLKKWHWTNLNRLEKRFINDILTNAGDGSDNPSDQVLMEGNAVTKKMANWLRAIGKKFLITKDTKVGI